MSNSIPAGYMEAQLRAAEEQRQLREKMEESLLRYREKGAPDLLAQTARAMTDMEVMLQSLTEARAALDDAVHRLAKKARPVMSYDAGAYPEDSPPVVASTGSVVLDALAQEREALRRVFTLLNSVTDGLVV